jgi:glucosyl-3-phosphoglycerate synthase
MGTTEAGTSVESWYRSHTYSGTGTDHSAVAELKQSNQLTISVCLPALNEAATVGAICRRVRSELIDTAGLVDELVVVDSGSGDGTAEVAAAAGATVHAVSDLPPRSEGGPGGKGEALWRSLSVVSGDVVVWLDADVSNFDPHFVTGLVRPLLLHDELVLTKAFYRRPLATAGSNDEGGRVTELAARPLLNLLHAQLAGFVQPLAGECAGRRDVLVELPFWTGYAVDVGLLLETVSRHGIHAIAQVDLGRRAHRNRDLRELGRMAFQVIQAIVAHADSRSQRMTPKPPTSLTQFFVVDGEHLPIDSELGVVTRPPMAEILKGRRKEAAAERQQR